jgi:predicted HNH restriction endonuclease
VPGQIAQKFLNFVRAESERIPRFAEEGDIEGLKTEAKRIVTKRSRSVRNSAFNAANNVCAVCDRDYSKVLNGMGVRVLQVHHRKQLSSFDAPAIVTPRDLAVVCANCHLLIHYNPKKALTVEAVRRMLRADG